MRDPVFTSTCLPLQSVQGIKSQNHRARQLYKSISMLFLFPVKDGKLSTGVNAIFDASCYGVFNNLKLPYKIIA